MRNFREELKNDACWSPSTQKLFEETGIPSEDSILQNREELIGFCEFLEENKIRSYLEIGTWTGRLVSTLHRLFEFDRVAVADIGYAKSIGLPLNLPKETHFFEGDSQSKEYMLWRQELGHIDLVMIDGDHSYQGILTDYEINRRFPHRFLAFHDIANPHPLIDGPVHFWAELEGEKIEIIKPHTEIGLDHTSMGIGIWSKS